MILFHVLSSFNLADELFIASHVSYDICAIFNFERTSLHDFMPCNMYASHSLASEETFSDINL